MKNNIDLSKFICNLTVVLSDPTSLLDGFRLSDLELELRKCMPLNRLQKSYQVEWINVDLGPIGNLHYPLTAMGKGSTLDLFTIEDLLLFSHYWVSKKKYKTFVDIGANIGLHSIVASLIGYRVLSFEPSPVNYDLGVQFSKRNSIDFTLIDAGAPIRESIASKPTSSFYVKAAVSNTNGSATFIEFTSNPYGNHLKGRKEGVYGEFKEIDVRLIAAFEIPSVESLIKIDAEGADFEVLESMLTLKDKPLKSKIFLCDWRDETRRKIYELTETCDLKLKDMFESEGLLSYSDLPKNHTAEFVILDF